jgi:sucrose phosphorylase
MIRKRKDFTGVHLIVYPDGIGGTLKNLEKGLSFLPPQSIKGVHILPPYLSSFDRGFAPYKHTEIDPLFGTWEDIRHIGQKYFLTLDLVVNHTSVLSKEFQDVLKKGNTSSFLDMFLDVDVFLKKNKAGYDALKKTYRPKPVPPYTRFRSKDGSVRNFWTTFSPEQIDFNWKSEKTKNLIKKYASHLVENGASCLRLDAVGYTAKKIYTESFMIPETLEVILFLRKNISKDILLLAEVHSSYTSQEKILSSGGSEYVYDNVLPLLMLYSLEKSDTRLLYSWLKEKSPFMCTVLDTHDGIGVKECENILSKKMIDETVSSLMQKGGNIALRANGQESENLDIYQINTTYFSALFEDEDAYIFARAIQLYSSGIPQIYFVGVVAGKNDTDLFEKTHSGRDVNRHNFSLEEWKKELQKKVSQRLLFMMHLRNTHPAFQGQWTIEQKDAETLILLWRQDSLFFKAECDIKRKKVVLSYTNVKKGTVEERNA